MGRVIASMSGDGWVPVRIMNPFDKAITLRRNSKIADVYPVVAVEDLSVHPDRNSTNMVSVQSQDIRDIDEGGCPDFGLSESLQKLGLGDLDSHVKYPTIGRGNWYSSLGGMRTYFPSTNWIAERPMSLSTIFIYQTTVPSDFHTAVFHLHSTRN